VKSYLQHTDDVSASVSGFHCDLVRLHIVYDTMLLKLMVSQLCPLKEVIGLLVYCLFFGSTLHESESQCETKHFILLVKTIYQ